MRAQNGTRQERGIRTEAAILDATLDLLASRGIQRTSLDLVARRVGVAKSSILWHFGSKEELLLRVAEHAFQQLAEGPARDILSLPTIGERSDAMWKSYARIAARRPQLRRLVLYLILESAESRPELRERLKHLYGTLRGLFSAGLAVLVKDDRLRGNLATISVAALDGIFLQSLLDPDAIDLAGLQEMVHAIERSTRKGGRASNGSDGPAAKPVASATS